MAELAERIRNARKAAGISQDVAAQETGLPQPSISAIESGKRSVDSLELARFAELYNKPLHYFLDSSFSDDTKSFGPLLESQHVLDSDRAVLDDFRVFCQDYAELEQLVLGKVNVVQIFEDVPPADTPTNAVAQATHYSSALRNMFGLGIEPLYDVRLFLDSIGIKAIKRKCNTPALTGIYVYSPEYGHCVLVNRSGNRQLDRFSLAHTLCHALLDWHVMKKEENFVLCKNWVGDSLIEYRANVFALNFLMPQDTVEKVWIRIRTKEKPGIFDTIAIARYFGVNYESTLERFVLLGMLTEKEKGSLWNELSDSAGHIDDLMGYAASEVRFSGEELYPDRYIKLCFEALSLGKTTAGRVAKYLGKSIYETNQLLQQMKAEPRRPAAGD